MVDLPTGKMKSREGTVVDADDLMAEMRDTARQISGENGKFEDATEKERNILFDQLGKGALKYFLLKVDPKKRMLFNPAESIDFAGHTGPFIQYTHARIRSIIRKSNQELHALPEHIHLNASERDVIKTLLKFPDIIAEAGSTYSPAVLANYLFELAKDFNQLYQTTPILKEADPALLSLRLQICRLTAQVIQRGTALLGIEAPERM
jgi:arginyl-tRNA synthetase